MQGTLGVVVGGEDEATVATHGHGVGDLALTSGRFPDVEVVQAQAVFGVGVLEIGRFCLDVVKQGVQDVRVGLAVQQVPCGGA